VSACERCIAEITQEFPQFRLVTKRGHLLSRAIDVALRIVTLGTQSQYLSHYHTVIGDTLYTPERWDSTSDPDRVIVLRHERVHLRQRRRYGLPLMAFIYFVPFFPIGLAYGRARLEWEAYEETLLATAELKGLAAARSPELREAIVKRFTGGAYAFMWPFRGMVERWYDQCLARIEARLAAPGAA
jgi:hypothetical protein